MITRLEIENFKAIKHLAIDLDPLTVLVGPNDSGKSTILQALDLLSRSIDRPVFAPGELSVFDRDPTELIYRAERARRIRISVRSDSGRYEVAFGWQDGAFVVVEEHLNGAVSAVGTGQRIELPNLPAFTWDGHRTLLQLYATAAPRNMQALRTELSSFLVAFDPKQLASPCPSDAALTASGAGLGAVIERILTDTDRTARDDYEHALSALSPHVSSVGTRPVAPTAHQGPATLKELVFGLRDRTRVPAGEASTGLLASAGYLALLHGTTATRFLVEEPENGVHPRAMLQIADVLRELARRGRQVVMTTHSPILLNYIDAEHIRIVTRTVEDGVKVTAALDSKVFNELSQKVDFGELWYMLGDEPLAATH